MNYLYFVERCNDHTSKLILNFNPYYKLLDKMKIRNIRHKGESSSSLAIDCLASLKNTPSKTRAYPSL